MDADGPRAEYERRAAAQAGRAAEEEARADRLSNLRLVVFGGAVLLFGLALADRVTAHALWLPLAAFVALVAMHARAAARARRARRTESFYRDGLRRLDGAWAGHGHDGAAFAPAEHDYAADLDLFGQGSLFELLCVARSRVGAGRLAEWLLEPAPPAVARARQAAVAELRDAPDLRETLALEEGEVGGALDRGAPLAWGRGPTVLPPHSPERWVHLALGLASATLLVLWLGDHVPGWAMLACMLVQYALAARRRAAVREVLEAADRPAQDLALVGRLLEILEGRTFHSPYLADRLAGLASQGVAPSRRIRALGRWVDLVDARRNQLFLPVSWLLSLGTQLAWAIEAWRARDGAALAAWLDAVAEVEAVASLAGYAHEHPADPFPEIVEDAVVLEGRGLAHPLLPEARAVRNDVALARDGTRPQALLVSGSNMSGKSTLLRTVGVNTVLALAGAPVRARALRVAPLAVGASIRIHDSLQAGASRFYAEIERLKRIVDLTADDRPTLFLLDEILHGTNSHDRCVGAAAVVTTLLDRGAVGLVTTHDLTLASMEASAGGRVRNMHFEDHVEAGRMAFDYTLREGVVARSNALALMRMVGLDVEDDARES